MRLLGWVQEVTLWYVSLYWCKFKIELISCFYLQHDDDFDDSYEGLLNLAATLGDVKPKSTPAEVLAKLEKGTYREWKASGGDQRCPICLDDVRLLEFLFWDRPSNDLHNDSIAMTTDCSSSTTAHIGCMMVVCRSVVEPALNNQGLIMIPH